MKKSNFLLATRVTAFAALVFFTATGCRLPPLPKTPDTLKGLETPPNSPSAPPPAPVSFYLNSNYLPTETDEGGNGVYAAGQQGRERLCDYRRGAVPRA